MGALVFLSVAGIILSGFLAKDLLVDALEYRKTYSRLPQGFSVGFLIAILSLLLSTGSLAYGVALSIQGG